jgi:hypothetical protein
MMSFAGRSYGESLAGGSAEGSEAAHVRRRPVAVLGGVGCRLAGRRPDLRYSTGKREPRFGRKSETNRVPSNRHERNL